jgi:hypothetical protein
MVNKKPLRALSQAVTMWDLLQDYSGTARGMQEEGQKAGSRKTKSVQRRGKEAQKWCLGLGQRGPGQPCH